jgi:hypothetical protein
MSTLAMGFALLHPGPHHGSEVPEGAAGPWMALLQENGVPVLKQVTVRLVPRVDEVLDSDGEKTGADVVVDGIAPGFVTLIRGPGLTPGEIKVPDQKPRPLFPGDRQWFVLGQQQVEVFGVGTTNEAGRIETFGLYAPPGTLLEVRGMAVEEGGGVPSVVFAGDIDRDGKLDFLVNTSTHYNVSETTLFLSHPDPERLVPVALTHTTGC